jgi:hypothetical protein
MKANIDDYGSLMRRAINYMLDDEKGFKAFLTDGAIELSNNAAYHNLNIIPTFHLTAQRIAV